MTCRDVINYIWANGLEDEEYFTNKTIVAMMDEDEAGKRFNVDPSVIRVWVNKDIVKGFNMNGLVYIPVDTVDPRLEAVESINKVTELKIIELRKSGVENESK